MEILEYRSCDPSARHGGLRVTLREFSKGDLEALKQMHALQGLDYQFPDLDDPIHVAKLVAENGQGIQMALIARATAEMYLLIDKTRGAPHERWQNFLALHERMAKRLTGLGAAEVHAFVPPQVERAFGRRLEKLGWYREPWACYTRLLRIPAREQAGATPKGESSQSKEEVTSDE